MRDYPEAAPVRDRVEPAPRRVRGLVNGRTVFDTRNARYVWESPKYPQYYIPLTDVVEGALVDEDRAQKLRRGTARVHGLRAGDDSRDGSGDDVRSGAARVYGADASEGLADTVRFEWDALDAWFEEDEEVFLHPRNPYARVDALRSSAHVQVSLAGTVLAESSSTVMVFETGLPTRYYFDRSSVDLARLERTDTESICPYKGRTSDYWNARVGYTLAQDVAWSYRYPTLAANPIAGLIAFYNDKVDISLDGATLETTEDISRIDARAAE